MLRSRTPLVLLALLATSLAGLGHLPVAAAEDVTSERADAASADDTTGVQGEQHTGSSGDGARSSEDAPASAAGEHDGEPTGSTGSGSSEGGSTGGSSEDGATGGGTNSGSAEGGASDGGSGSGATGNGATGSGATDGGASDDGSTDDGSLDEESADGEVPEEDEEATIRAAAQPPAGGFPIRGAVRAVGNPTPDVRFLGSGWGHGVGMSQYGAYNMAKRGHSAAGILNHYYPGTEVGTDARADERIRVNLHAGVATASIEAIDAPIEWRHCRPRANETIDHRVNDCTLDDPPASDPTSTVFHVQPAGTTLRVCFWNGEGVTPPPAQPVAGLKLVSGNSCSDNNAIVATTDRPVLRAYHHGNMVRTRLAAGDAGRRYQHGWQDFHRKTLGIDVVQDINSVERYLEGLAESIRSWGLDGPAALEAQAITGRTFALRAKAAPRGLRAGTRACSCDLLNTPSDQVYAGRDFALAQYGNLWVNAVTATNHQVLRYDGALAQTYYSSSHGGGRSEAVHESWAYGNTPVPYLRSVNDPYSMNEPHSFRAWTSNATHAAFAAHVSSGRPAPLSRVERVQILSRTQGGTPKEIQVTGVTANGATDTFVFTHRTNDSQTLREKQVAGASFRLNLPTSGHPTAAGARLPSSQISSIGFAPFTDDDGLTHEYAITWANRAGIAEGVDETRFNPGGNVTRAQMASFIYRTFQIPAPTVRGGFSDVSDPNATHAIAIDALAEAGVAGGYADGTYRPADNVTREQMATFIARAAGLSTAPPQQSRFSDVRVEGTHAGAVNSVAQAGITQGCTPDGTRYCPMDPVSRQQMASFLRRAATS
ncbi:S-layer homology domain-containing protein [Egicoccus sp. AB-alg6-2]|uniref:S-layer homology domain-containing protein n=1 Tax=Egicoccus sp. AB-alg6-2 TaxID=3242692 RepID=UPI00359E18CA